MACSPPVYGVSVTLIDAVPSATRSIPFWNSASGIWWVTIRSIGSSPFASIEIAVLRGCRIAGGMIVRQGEALHGDLRLLRLAELRISQSQCVIWKRKGPGRTGATGRERGTAERWPPSVG